MDDRPKNTTGDGRTGGLQGAARRVFLLAVIVAGLFAPLASQPVFGPEFDVGWLVRDGVFNGKIYLPNNPASEERDAAETLAVWIERVSGVKPEIAAEGAGAAASGIYTGATRRAGELGVRAPDADGEAWAWEMRNGNALFILGNTPLATRLAVGEFIQRHLGVAFLLPGEWGAEWERRGMIAAPRSPHVCRPAYRWRYLGGLGDSPEAATWLRDNGFGVLPSFSHALHHVFDAEIARKRPDFFPLLDGRRELPSGRGALEPQPNLAAPGAATHAARRAAAFFSENPREKVFPLGINDNMTWDESETSRVLAPPGRYFRGKPDYSNYVFVFMNRVATALWPSPVGVPGRGWDAVRWRDLMPLGGEPPVAITPPPPDKLLGCIAYSHCERTPDFPLHPNIFPVLTADRSQWRDPVFRQHDSRLIRQWARSGVRHFGLYDYYYGRDFLLPRVFFDEEIDSIRWGADNGASLFYAELYPEWSFDAPKAWLAGRLLLYPSQNSALLLRHFFNEAYGPAAAPMREFFDTAGLCWEERAGPARWLKFWRVENMGALVSVENQRRMRTALDEAARSFPPAHPVSLAAHDNNRLLRQQVRVRMVSLAFEVTERFLAYYRLRENLLRRTPATPAEARETLRLLAGEAAARREFLDALERWNRSSLNLGGRREWGRFLTGGVGYTVVERLLRTAKTGLAAGGRVGAQWSEVWHETTRFATQHGAGSLVSVLARSTGARLLASEDFGAAGFAPAADGRGAVSLPNPPWRVSLVENETLRLGFRPVPSPHDNTAENGDAARRLPEAGFLRILGSERVALSRDVAGVEEGEWVVAKAVFRGRVNPGTYAALELQFLDARGGKIRGRHVSIIHPVDTGEQWQPVVCLGRAPAGAAGARVTIHSREQEADEGIDWDDAVIWKLCAK
ncbi:MAG: DUF4838 domain-containing protein [Puniceicoccales bacterium]|jgi:hypothetical protein|nr:DUF4838 domain-containing protein [Puniceicoccales bacterium]